MERPIYLDYNATTPVDPAVIEVMLPFLVQEFGNASSAHAYGTSAARAVSEARDQVSALLGCAPDEIVFTGGGSESINLALKGVVLARLSSRPHVVTSTIEHPAVLSTLSYLTRRFGVEVTAVPVDDTGRVSVDDVSAALHENTVLVSIMHANNETGTLQPVCDIGRLTRPRDIVFHVDAAQTAGKVPVEVTEIGCDLLTIAGHKLYAPKGVGALYVRRGTMMDPLIHGAGQENGLRAGTENVAGIVGLGMAAEVAGQRLGVDGSRLASLRDDLHARLVNGVPGIALNGHESQRLPTTLNVSFPDVLGSAVLALAPEIAASTGSACHAGRTDPSPVLSAMGLARERALGAVRLSLGRSTTRDEIEFAAGSLIRAYREARSYSASMNA